jgi:mannose-6-phosphate isomerase-like protein (cupin superfamily)
MVDSAPGKAVTMKKTTVYEIASARDEPGSDQRQWFEGFAGTLMSVRSSGEQTSGAYSIFESVVDPLRGPPLHYYKHTDTVFQPLDGSLRIACDSEEFDLPPGHRVAIPRGVHQTWRNDTKKPIRFLITFCPGGIETLLPQLPGLSAREQDEVMSRYGVFIVGPGIGEDLLTNWPRQQHLSAR